jgi:hypothetical protein
MALRRLIQARADRDQEIERPVGRVRFITELIFGPVPDIQNSRDRAFDRFRDLALDMNLSEVIHVRVVSMGTPPHGFLQLRDFADHEVVLNSWQGIYFNEVQLVFEANREAYVRVMPHHLVEWGYVRAPAQPLALEAPPTNAPNDDPASIPVAAVEEPRDEATERPTTPPTTRFAAVDIRENEPQ